MKSDAADGMVDRLALAARRAGGKTRLSEKADIPLSTLNDYFAGQKLPADRAAALAIAADVSLEWLVTGTGLMERTPPSAKGLEGWPNAAPKWAVAGLEDDQSLYGGMAPPPADFALVPRYDIAASAGPGVFADREQLVDYMAFQRDFIRGVLRADPSHLVLIAARGDSMEPAIRAGDLLLVDRSFERLDDDAIYVIVRDGAVQVKRLRRGQPGEIEIISDNRDAYAPVTLRGDVAAGLEIKGRVRWIGRLI